jgi:CheY-like chemotaxis protein
MGTLVARVLLVEDDVGFAYAARRHLEAQGHTVLTAANSTEALQAFEQGSIDITICDVQLTHSEHDGLALAHIIRSSEPAMPIVLVTGFPERLAGHSRVPGVVFIKPLELSTLSSAVNSGLASKLS